MASNSFPWVVHRSQGFHSQMTFETGWTTAVHLQTHFDGRPLVKPTKWITVICSQHSLREGRGWKRKNRALVAKKQVLQWACWGWIFKEWPRGDHGAFRSPAKSLLCSCYTPGSMDCTRGFWIIPTMLQGQRQMFVCSPKNQKQLDAWQSKSEMRVAVTHLWSCLCDWSPPMNHTVTCTILPPTSYYHQDKELRTRVRNEVESRSVKCIFAERTLANIPMPFSFFPMLLATVKSMRGSNANQ